MEPTPLIPGARGERSHWHRVYERELTGFEQISDRRVRVWLFHPISIVAHTIWFLAWIVAGLSVNTLTMIVSLEAIYITLFLGVGQEMGAKRGIVDQLQRDGMQRSIEELVEINNEMTAQIHAVVTAVPAPSAAPKRRRRPAASAE